MEMLFEEEQRKIQAISDRLQRDSNSIAVLVINKDGQEIARAGQTKDCLLYTSQESGCRLPNRCNSCATFVLLFCVDAARLGCIPRAACFDEL